MSTEIKPKIVKEVKKEEFVSKDDFNSLLESVSTIAKSVGELSDRFNNPTVVKKEEVRFEDPDKTHLPPRWRELCDQVLGKDFGLNVVYPETGRGFLIKVIVPKEKSNANQDHWEFYKTDIRTKSISFAEGAEGVKLYFEKIQKNLKLDPREINK